MSLGLYSVSSAFQPFHQFSALPRNIVEALTYQVAIMAVFSCCKVALFTLQVQTLSNFK